MCGIVGYVRADGRAVDAELLARMCDAIRHRGPDDDGFHLSGPAGIAMRRLSVIDLESGKQPMHNPARTAWIVFNGEIYNYQELRAELEKKGHRFYTNSDTEVIVQLYDLYGADCVQSLRGMFAFAIWDEARQQLLLARDRVGKKPLLYSLQNGQLIFGSEFRALLEHPDISRTVDYEAIDRYLSFLSVPAPLTAFSEIRKLLPGHTLVWSRGAIKIERYWSLKFTPKLKISEADAAERALHELRTAVRLRLISDVPLGAFLSGGVDSSAIVALMAQEGAGTVKTFSIGFEEQDFSELKHARRVAAFVGAEHHEFIVRPDALELLPTLVEHYGEPFADSSALPTYYVARETRKHVTVALNGDGGDECFAGYERYAALRWSEAYRKIPLALRKGLIERIAGALPSSPLRRSRTRDLQRFLDAASMPRVDRYLRWVSVMDDGVKADLYTDAFRNRTNAGGSSALLAEWFAAANGCGDVDAALLTDTMTYLPNDLLVKVDIATMAVSLEARSPFLDHHVLEFAASLPERFKLRGLTTKYLLKKMLAGLVPAENLRRSKMGFGVPISHWFRGELQQFLRETLLSERSMRRDLFKPESVRRLIDQHVAGVADHAQKLWTLLMLELWFQRFIDG